MPISNLITLAYYFDKNKTKEFTDFINQKIMKNNSSFSHQFLLTSSMKGGLTPIDCFAYHPVALSLYSENGTQIPTIQFLGRFNFDISNCGIGYIHQIHNLGIKGLGVRVLYILEQLILNYSRKYILCSINSKQREMGYDKFLIRHGYSELSTFKGGNSGNKCWIFAKDCNKQPPVCINEKETKTDDSKKEIPT